MAKEKKIERIELVGIIYYPVLAFQQLRRACEDLWLHVNPDEEDRIDEVEKGLDNFRRIMPDCYIVSGGKLFRVTKENTPEKEKCPDGSEVHFETPVASRGKHRWAYNIRPMR